MDEGHTHTHTHSVLTAIYPGEPGLAGCPLNSPSPFIPELCIQWTKDDGVFLLCCFVLYVFHWLIWMLMGYCYQNVYREAWQPLALSQGNQEHLMVKDKVGELGWASLWNVLFAPFSAPTLVMRQDGHPACKNLDVGLSLLTISPELYTSYISSCQHHLHHS